MGTAKSLQTGGAATVKRTMQGWAIDAYGGPDRLGLRVLPVPEPGPADILVRMHAAEVGDWDILVREGQWPMERPFPLVLGLAGSGTVAAIGQHVSSFTKSDDVYVYSYPLYHNGSWAEYMLVPASYVARAPRSLDLTQAGAVPIVGLTALETVTEILELRKGESILITAAAGGVGHLAVQMARHLDAHILATASSRNHDFVRALGAETVIDYEIEDLIAAVHRRYPRGVDKALNGVAGETADKVLKAVRPAAEWSTLPGRPQPAATTCC